MRFVPLWLLLLSTLVKAHAAILSIKADRVASAGFAAQAVAAKWDGTHLALEAREADFAGRKFKDPRIDCSKFRAGSASAGCGAGVVKLDESWPFSLDYRFAAGQLNLKVDPAPGESWRARYRPGGFELELAGAKPQHLNPWLSPGVPGFGAGAVDGRIAFSRQHGTALVAVSNLGFSDPSGLHAGEGISGKIRVDATREQEKWRFSDEAVLSKGEVFWQPFYFKGGKRFFGGGSYDGKALAFEDSTLELPGIGVVTGSAWFDAQTRRLIGANLRGEGLALDELNRQILKPTLQDTDFSEMSMHGSANVSLEIADSALQRLDLSLLRASIEDDRGRFAVIDLNAEIPWDARVEREAKISFERGKLFRIPLGRVNFPITMHGNEFFAPHVAIPVVDGRLDIDDFHARSDDADWHWEFRGGLTPVSMPELSRALGIPVMQGTLSGVIPKVSFADLRLAVDGALLFKVFDGTVVAQHLRMLDPFGPAPRLGVDLDMRNLDLGMLTRTYSFGSMEGRIDASVKSLELSDWQPVKFDAWITSSPGDYPKKISQRAVQNISALGGAGAAAAIERSFLSFFKEFGYEKIGISCVLARGVCRMGGIESRDSGYLLVKGGGIPAINVIGYNRNIGWSELVTRLKRIAAQNVTPIVQ